MFNKKIIASALIGSLAFTLFPTNIFANNDIVEIEKKLCENINFGKEDFGIEGNKLKEVYIDSKGDYYYNIEGKNLKNLQEIGINSIYDYIIRQDIKYTSSENKIENIKTGEVIFTTRNLEENEYIDFLKKDGNDIYYYIKKYIFKEGFSDKLNVEIYKNHEKLYFLENIEKSTGGSFYSISIDNQNNIYYSRDGKLNDDPNGEFRYDLEIYKNGVLLNNIEKRLWSSVDMSEGYFLMEFQTFINSKNDHYTIISGANMDFVFNIYKNGKPLCENLENNSGNNGNTTTVSGGSPVSNPEDLKLKKDPRVLDQNNSSNSTKTEETKKEEIDKKIEELNGILENYNELMPHVIGHENSFGHYNWDLDGKSKHYISFKIQNILEKNSYNIIRNIYKNSSKEKIKKLASENNFISYYLEEYKKQFEELELKIDSYTYNLPIEVIKKIKTRIKTFFEKYDNLDYLVRIYKVLKSDPKIQKQAETSKEVYYIINIYNVNLVYDIINEDIQKNYDINLDIEEIRKKQEENFQKYKANLKN